MPKITLAQAQRLIQARSYSDTTRKSAKKNIFAEIKRQHGIPESTKLKVEIDDTDALDYLVLKFADTGVPLPDPQLADAPAIASANQDTQTEGPTAPKFRYGSIAVDDALKLLRADADDYDTYAASAASAKAPVYIEGERLFFVL